MKNIVVVCCTLVLFGDICAATKRKRSGSLGPVTRAQSRAQPVVVAAEDDVPLVVVPAAPPVADEEAHRSGSADTVPFDADEAVTESSPPFIVDDDESADEACEDCGQALHLHGDDCLPWCDRCDNWHDGNCAPALQESNLVGVVLPKRSNEHQYCSNCGFRAHQRACTDYCNDCGAYHPREKRCSDPDPYDEATEEDRWPGGWAFVWYAPPPLKFADDRRDEKRVCLQCNRVVFGNRPCPCPRPRRIF